MVGVGLAFSAGRTVAEGAGADACERCAIGSKGMTPADSARPARKARASMPQRKARRWRGSGWPQCAQIPDSITLLLPCARRDNTVAGASLKKSLARLAWRVNSRLEAAPQSHPARANKKTWPH